MNMPAAEVKAMVAGFFRYKSQCPIIAFEASDELKWSSGEPADLLVVTKSRMLYEIEVKVSLSDLKSDIKKRKHQFFTNAPEYLPVHKFFFAVPNEIDSQALVIVEERFPYAGLLAVSKFPFNSAALDFGVRVIKSPKQLNSKPLSMKGIVFLVREQSGTVCRLARDKALAERDTKEALTKVKEIIKGGE